MGGWGSLFSFKGKDSSWRNKACEASFGARKTSKNRLIVNCKTKYLISWYVVTGELAWA